MPELNEVSGESVLGRKLVEVADLKTQIAELTEKFEKKQQECIEALRTSGSDRFEVQTAFLTLTGTVVAAERVVYDSEGLENDLSPEDWERVTKRVLDTDKLEAMVVAQVIPIEAVDAHTEVKVNKPYLRIKATKKRSVAKRRAKKQTVRATVI